MPWTSVQRVLQKFVEGGFKLEILVSKRARHFDCIPQHIKKVLLSKDMLQTWSPYSIVERVFLLREQLGVTVSTSTLWQFYRANGVSFRTGTAVYRQYITQSERMTRDRSAFSRLVANLIANRESQIIYVDETTYSTVSLKPKSWAPSKHPNLHAKNNKQMRRTLIGGIGTCLIGGRCMRLAKSTNQIDFRTFLVDLK